MDDKPEFGVSRREEIGQRLAAIRTRMDELKAGRRDDASPAVVSERIGSAQRQAAASQAAAEQATTASIRAFRRAAEAHEHAALQHERAAAAEQCPFGHSLALGRPQTVGWKPCICKPALEAAAEGRGMGHLLISCGRCHDELRTTTFYEPPHDITRRRAGL